MGTHPIFESDFDCLTDEMDELVGYSVRTFSPGSIGDSLKIVSQTTDEPNFRPWCHPRHRRSVYEDKKRSVLLELDSESFVRSLEVKVLRTDLTNVNELCTVNFRFSFGHVTSRLTRKSPVFQETSPEGITFHFVPPEGASSCSISPPIKFVQIETNLFSVGRGALHIELRGVSSPDRVEGIKSEISKYHENQTLRVTLKFLRQKGYQTAFDALMSEMEEPEYFLENPIVSKLYETIVSKGDYSEAEKLIE